MKHLPALLLPAVLAAQSLPAPLAAHLKSTAVLHLDFVQTRHIAALSRPLRSSGSLVVARDRGLIWRMAKPLPLTIVAAKGGVLEVDREGRRKLQSAKDNPMAAQMARILTSLLQGDTRALEGLFTFRSSSAPGGRWTLDLTPQPAAAPFVKSVSLRGGRFVEQVRVVDGAGDTTDILFSGFRPDAALDPAEVRLLDLQ